MRINAVILILLKQGFYVLMEVMACAIECILGTGLVYNRYYSWISDSVCIRYNEHTSEPGNNKSRN